MKNFLFFLSALFLSALCAITFVSCRTIDMQKKISNDSKRAFNLGSAGDPLTPDEQREKNTLDNKINEQLLIEETVIEIEPEIVYIEKPVYIPPQNAKTPAGGASSNSASAASSGKDSVMQSLNDGTVKPSDYSHAARIYDYHADFVYEIYAQPLRTTDIYLQAGENIVDVPFIADSERWIVAGGLSYEGEQTIQHIYVKPKGSDLSASMVINTDRRVYHILLRSYKDAYMPIVRWQYKLTGFENIRRNQTPTLNSGGNKAVQNNPNTPISQANIPAKVNSFTEMDYVDPRYLSFDYKLTYGIFGKYSWNVKLVYDDGSKTYIEFPDGVLQKELPAIFENRSDIINYRVNGNLAIIDKLITNVTVKLGKKKINIEKKRAYGR
jgi:type IV secretion system protein VirB9